VRRGALRGALVWLAACVVVGGDGGLGGGAVAFAAEPAALTGNPFWQMNLGWWQGENTYFDGEFNYNIRAYGSLLHIEIAGGVLRQTEYKFYAPSRIALGLGHGATQPDEGVELDTVTLAEPLGDDGSVRVTRVTPQAPPGETTIAVLKADTAMSVTHEAGASVDDYRMFITLPTRDRRYVANFGIIDGAGTDPDPAHVGPPGALRGFSVFRQTRVPDAEVSRLREELRARYHVRARVDAGPDGRPRLERLP